MKWGHHLPSAHGPGPSLRVLGSVGEPDQPRGLICIAPTSATTAPGGGEHLVADGDGAIMIRPVAGVTRRHKARRAGDAPLPGIKNGEVVGNRRRTGGQRRRGLVVVTEAVAPPCCAEKLGADPEALPGTTWSRFRGGAGYSSP